MRRTLLLLAVVTAGCVPSATSSTTTAAPTTSTAPATSPDTTGPATTAPPVATSPPATSGVMVELFDVSELVKQVRTGVVTVSQRGLSLDMFNRPFEQTGTGTGIVIDAEGRILTNFHVVAGADEIIVFAEDGRPRSAVFVDGRAEQDLALVRVDDVGGLAPLPLGSSEAMEVGNPVIAIGNALGLDETSPSVSVGIVSALGRSLTTETGAQLGDLIQTDAAINPGNSGGPLLNRQGEVIGINTAIAGGAENIGFAISIDSAKQFIEEALSGAGTPFIGVTLTPNSADLAARFGLPTDAGVVVASVFDGSPAGEAGFRVGDVILEIDGAAVTSVEDVTGAIAAAGAGGQLNVLVARGAAQGELTVDIAER